MPFVETAKNPRTVVIDFSSPNVAKPMHVGHIRSTILGDTLARVLRLLGHKVVTDNHIGDWGTQFGMLLLGWKTELDEAALEKNPIAELERIYKLVNDDESLRDATNFHCVQKRVCEGCPSSRTQSFTATSLASSLPSGASMVPSFSAT